MNGNDVKNFSDLDYNIIRIIMQIVEINLIEKEIIEKRTKNSIESVKKENYLRNKEFIQKEIELFLQLKLFKMAHGCFLTKQQRYEPFITRIA